LDANAEFPASCVSRDRIHARSCRFIGLVASVSNWRLQKIICKKASMSLLANVAEFEQAGALLIKSTSVLVKLDGWPQAQTCSLRDRGRFPNSGPVPARRSVVQHNVDE
jgi:hypothetical protein